MGGRTPTSGNNQTLTAWLYLESDVNHAGYFVLYIDNNTGDGYGMAVNADGTTFFVIVIDNGAPTDTATLGALTVSRWYSLTMVRAGTDFRFYLGDEATPSSLQTTLSQALNDQNAGFGLGLLGAQVADISLNARIERWKHYTEALSLTRINEERCSLAPTRTTNLFSYNPLTTAGRYAGTEGSAPYTFTEQGGLNFSSSGGPTPSCAAPGTPRSR